MSAGKYILHDGAFVPTEEFRLGLNDVQSLRLTEKFRAVRTSFPFFTESHEMLKLKLVVFNLEFPEFTERSGAGLLRQMSRTLTKNKFFMGACLTVSVWQSNAKVHYSIQPEKLEFADYTLNEKGIYVDVFDKIQKPVSALSNLTTGSELFWKVAQAQQPEGIDEMLIMNTDDLIIEAPESNIYLISGNKVIATNGECGAYLDVTRSVMAKIFRQMKMEITYNEGILVADLENAEEIMLVNSVDGIRWVAGYSGKRYFNNIIKKVQSLFGQLAVS